MVASYGAGVLVRIRTAAARGRSLKRRAVRGTPCSGRRNGPSVYKGGHPPAWAWSIHEPPEGAPDDLSTKRRSSLATGRRTPAAVTAIQGDRLVRRIPRFHLRAALAGSVLGAMAWSTSARAVTLSNGTFTVQIGKYGEISSLQIVNDSFSTNYVMNAANAPGQNTADHEWVGELMFAYKLGPASTWTTALTNQSDDVRTIASNATSVTVTYQGSAHPSGIRNFKLVETYALVDDHLSWQIALTNTSAQSIELGGVGLPLPFNEYWNGGDTIYEQRVVYHSFTGNNSSYITVKRPSGVGPFLLMTPDATTGAGFEYMDAWIAEEHPGSAWAAGGGHPAWDNGLDVFYIHSNAIKATNRGYLPNTSLTLAPSQSKTYAFKLFKVADEAEVKSRLYSEGLIDVTVVPGMMFATDMNAKVDLHTSKPIASVTAQYPAETKITPLPVGPAGADHHLYQIDLGHLGPNDITVSYGNGETTTLQLYAIEPIDQAIQRHATFMVKSTQWGAPDPPPNPLLNRVFDDWMMDSKSKRGATGGWGWGDDWGFTKAEFLAEKNAETPVAAEVQALDDYLETAIWDTDMVNDHNDYFVDDWLCPANVSQKNPANCWYNRAFAYPHVYNTYLSMYKIAERYPQLIQYRHPADTYLLRSYHIFDGLYTSDPGDGRGFMGQQTTPDLLAALQAAGHVAEAQNVTSIVDKAYAVFHGQPYPYASEYAYDNTGEEGVYTAAKMKDDPTVLGQVNAKTRACRGQQPTWYYYADPVTGLGENWWQFQYTTALAGYCMDDWLRTYSTAPEEDERLSYAAKIANIGAINSGQIDPDPANLGTVAWSYQAMKGNYYRGSAEGNGSQLHNGWREMSGEADLGLFGAIRILSSDVAVDPVFGLYGYGCDVSEIGSCYAITPKDGVFKRINLITQKLHLEIDLDQIAAATLSTNNDYVGLTLKNLTPSTAHTTTVTLVGLSPRQYEVTVGNTSAGTVTAISGAPTVVPLPIGTEATYAVHIGSGCQAAQADAGSGAGPAGGTGGGSGAGGAGGAGSAGGPHQSAGYRCATVGDLSSRERETALLALGGVALVLARRRRSGRDGGDRGRGARGAL
jgi:hypothetical protein